MAGQPYGNALAESVIGLYKTECVRHDGPFRTVDDLELATLSWRALVQHRTTFSAVGYATPVEFENAYYRQINPDSSRCRENPPSTEPRAVHQDARGLCIERCFRPDTPAGEAGRKARR